MNTIGEELLQTVKETESVFLLRAAVQDTSDVSDIRKFGKTLELSDGVLQKLEKLPFARLFLLAEWVNTKPDANLRNLAYKLFQTGFVPQATKIMNGFKSKIATE